MIPLVTGLVEVGELVEGATLVEVEGAAGALLRGTGQGAAGLPGGGVDGTAGGGAFFATSSALLCEVESG
jgi:hypothetical protein